MGLKPAFELQANDKDITEAIQKRLVSLRVTDQAGWESDTLEIVLEDSDPENPLALPSTGAELTLMLGYQEALHKMGLFVVDAIELSGPPNQIRIQAKAVTQDQTPKGKTSLQTQKTRPWEKGTTLGSMVETIASEHKLGVAIAKALAVKVLPHTDQLRESDINLLTRVAQPYDAVVKPAAGKLIVVKRAQAQSASGKALPKIELHGDEITRWRMNIRKREQVASVVAVYRDIKQAKDLEFVAGGGEPIKLLKHQYADADVAKEAAESELAKSKRAERTLSLSMPGKPQIRAERIIELQGVRSGVDGSWIVNQVEHNLDKSGLTTSCQCVHTKGVS